MRRAVPRPDLPGDDLARRAKFAKPQFRASLDAQMDTTGLPLRKIHPDRNEDYRRWLHFQPCAIRGLKDHVCWSRERRHGVPISDPCHSGKAYSGRLKRNDSGCLPLCRLAHDEQERNMDAFDARYGVDRFAIAAEHFARFMAEREVRR